MKKYFTEGDVSGLSDVKEDAWSIYEELRDMCIEVEQGGLRGYTCLRGVFDQAIEVMQEIDSSLSGLKPESHPLSRPIGCLDIYI